MKKFASNSWASGMTLVELLVVVGIIGILAAALITIINPVEQLAKSNDAKRKSDLSQIQKALETYYSDNGRYPDTSGSPSYYIRVGATNYAWGSAWQPYSAKLPQDPSSSNVYIYNMPAASNGQTYYLYANLERDGRDPQACNTAGTACTSVPGGVTCGGTNACNFGVSSSNVTP